MRKCPPHTRREGVGVADRTGNEEPCSPHTGRLRRALRAQRPSYQSIPCNHGAIGMDPLIQPGDGWISRPPYLADGETSPSAWGWTRMETSVPSRRDGGRMPSPLGWRLAAIPSTIPPRPSLLGGMEAGVHPCSAGWRLASIPARRDGNRKPSVLGWRLFAIPAAIPPCPSPLGGMEANLDPPTSCTHLDLSPPPAPTPIPQHHRRPVRPEATTEPSN